MSAIYYRGYTQEELLAFWQPQPGATECGAYALAIAGNLFRGQNSAKGAEVQDFLERNRAKLKGGGTPAWKSYARATQKYLPDGSVKASGHNSIASLKDALKAGGLPIVAVSWQTNRQIAADLLRRKMLRIGHYMVAVGYSAEHVHLLDPGAKTQELNALHVYADQALDQIWNGQSNIFVPRGMMFTIYGL